MIFSAIKKRGIYQDVSVNFTNTVKNSIEPSDEYDAMYFVFVPPVAQYFYSTVKHGKQVFAVDATDRDPEYPIGPFIKGVEMYAIRE